MKKSKSFRMVYESLVTGFQDCNEIDLKTLLFGAGKERDLNFNTLMIGSVTALEMLEIMDAACPGGYNRMNKDALVKIAECFEDAEFYLGREGSPVLYIKPKSRLWFGDPRHTEIGTLADEVSFEASIGMFRVWFD
jgi:hypothetical protein